MKLSNLIECGISVYARLVLYSQCIKKRQRLFFQPAHTCKYPVLNSTWNTSFHPLTKSRSISVLLFHKNIQLIIIIIMTYVSKSKLINWIKSDTGNSCSWACTCFFNSSLRELASSRLPIDKYLPSQSNVSSSLHNLWLQNTLLILFPGLNDAKLRNN